MTTTPREIGTLIVVVLKANHLPNKRHIGKQDPYCAITLNGQTRRTKAIKKGGQHPEWDEEIRFQVFEDDENLPQPPSGTPPPLPPKSNKITSIKGGMMMKVACYADDAREPDLIGEGLVDLTEVITRGESDEWYTLTYKDRFAGKVYLEMTLYSNEPEPPKKKKATALSNNGVYIGPGVFEEEGGQSNRIVSASVVQDQGRRQSDSYSLRPSSSLAQLDLYQAPYENQAIDSLTNNFGEFGITNSRRRETLPSSISSYRPTSSAGFSTISSQTSLYDPSGNTYRPVTPNDQPAQAPYPAEHQPSSYRPGIRKGRYSIPATSSGFVTLSTSASTLNSSASSNFNVPHAQNGYGLPISHTPAPYNPPAVMYDAGGYPTPSHTPLPPAPIPGDYHPGPSQTPFPSSYSNLSHSRSFENGNSLPQQTEPYPPYPHHGSVPAPPSQLPIPTQSTSLEGYQGYSMASPPRDNVSLSNSAGGSRPLPPQPQGFVQAVPLHLNQQQSYGAYNNSYMGSSGQPGTNGFPSVPPPPPIPPPQSQSPLHGSPQSHFTTETNQYMATPPSTTLSVPTPPQHTPHRRASLPQPPMQASALYPSLPSLPAPPISDFHGIPPPPPIPSHGQSFYPGPPPKPPAQPLYYDPTPQPHNVYLG